jgi:hypothetical protein
VACLTSRSLFYVIPQRVRPLLRLWFWPPQRTIRFLPTNTNENGVGADTGRAFQSEKCRRIG